MITLNSILFSIVAGLISFKVIILAAAAVLALYSLSARIRPHTVAPAPGRVHSSARARKLDVYV
ncbi:MAG: hypothetical protein WBN96_05960 [Gammaproteobacteria bacterium]